MTNRLAQESSPYLLQHSENPVNWLPWGEEALRRARELDRPIFLSIGYAACHWCHVMAHESFEDPEIAERLNRDFVPVKVDREERPDIDAIYMDAVVALTGQGGWPLSVFLTPDGQPFFGGTYFPPIGRHSLPSFGDVLSGLARAWRDHRDQVLASGRSLTDLLTGSASAPAAEGTLRSSLVSESLETLLRSYDWTHGGWGGAPKFPQSPVLHLLLERHRRGRDSMALTIATHALDAMAGGGIFDPLGGGFHRYSVDASWSVPHFEKMLYDNAQLARIYLRAWRSTQEPRFRRVAEATLGFLYREMLDARGGFFSSLDADSAGGEGLFYTWTPEEIRAAVMDPALSAAACDLFHVTASGNLDGRSVLRHDPGAPAGPVLSAEAIENLRKRLFEARQARPRPSLDDKIVAAWNGLTLVALAEAAQAWERTQDLEAAQHLGDFLLSDLSRGGGLLRSERAGRPGPAAFLEDHAAVGLGLVALYQTDFDPRWYKGAVAQAEAILTRFADPAGGFFDTPVDHEPLLTRPRSIQDSPTPSGGALAVELLLTLHGLSGEDRYRKIAETALAAMQETAAAHPTAFAAWLTCIQSATSPSRQLALIGNPDEPDVSALLKTARQADLPGLVFAAGIGRPPADVPLLADRVAIKGQATAYLCEGFTCRLPVTTPQELLVQMHDAAQRAGEA